MAALLRGLREARNESEEEVEIRFERELRSGDTKAQYSDTEIAGLFRWGGIDAIEDDVDGAVDLTYDDCVLLSKAYEFPRLLVDALLSTPADDVCLVERFDRCLVVGDSSEAGYGHGATYGTPPRRLAGANSVSILHLRLGPRGYSDTHWHPGEELTLVLRGSVDVLLLDRGLRARLNTADYIHFYAEHEHCVLNAGTDPAEMFIIRLRRSKRRKDLIGGLRSRKPKSGVAAAARQGLLSTLVVQERSWRSGQAPCDTVVDRTGLGRFLQLVCERQFRPEGRLTLDHLAGSGASYGISRAKFDRIHHGLSPVSRDELLVLAKIYDVEPLLLYDFLCPALRSAVAVRSRPDPDVEALSDTDMRRLPEEFLRSSDAVYTIPCRRLADTDAAIAFLFLPPGAQSPVNRHPGHEIILPLKGEVRVRFAGGGVDAAVSAERGEFTHFASFRDHWVENCSTQDAEVFVVRVHE